MDDGPRDARPAAPTLREYLADRDVACDQCGYNLRGARDVFCPECGAVIPRPPAEHIARLQIDPAALKLWCPECDYVVTGVNAKCCPECAGSSLTRFIGEKPPMRRRLWLRPQGLPLPLWLNAVFGALLLIPAIGRFAVGASTSKPGATLMGALVAAVLALGPVVVAAVWAANRRAIRALSPANRLNAAGIAFLVGMLSWMAAFVVVK